MRLIIPRSRWYVPELRGQTSEWQIGGPTVSPVHWNLAKWLNGFSRKRITRLADGGGGVVRPFRNSLRESRLCQHRNHRGEVESPSRRDMTTNGRQPSRNTGHRCSPNGLRISPSAFTARLIMTCWSRLQAGHIDIHTYPSIPRVPGTVTPFARLMTRWHLALPRPKGPFYLLVFPFRASTRNFKTALFKRKMSSVVIL